MMSTKKMQLVGLLTVGALALSTGHAGAVPYSGIQAAAVAPAASTFNGAKVENVQWRRGGWRGHRWRGGRGIGLGILGGALLGGALAAPYSYRPYSYYPRHRYFYSRPNYSSAHAYCSRRFRSYDPASGTYLGYDGRRHACP